MSLANATLSQVTSVSGVAGGGAVGPELVFF